MPARNVNLTAHLADFVDASVRSGRFQNASEVVREALRLLEARQREDDLKLDGLRQAVAQGREDAAQGRTMVLTEQGGRRGSLFGAHRGSVGVRDGADLIAPALDVAPDAEIARRTAVPPKPLLDVLADLAPIEEGFPDIGDPPSARVKL
jgi:antitoxin ParD1/3/4